MRKTGLTVAVVGVASALALSACSSSSGGGTGSSAPAPAGNSSSASSSASSSSGGGGGGGGAQVGVILPDTTTSTRYTLYDAPLLGKAFAAAGVKSDIQNAGGSVSKFQQIAQSMLGEGVKVLVIDALDQTSGAKVEQAAQQAGVKVIDYDRVNLGGTAPYYVSFDNEGVGKLQASTLVNTCLKGKSNPRILMMDGGTDTDNNAVLFAKGAHDVLDPLKAQKKVTIVSESVVKGWDVNLAAPTFTQALTAAGGQVDGVLAANDDISNAVITVLKSKGLAGKVPTTGQDAGVNGIQNILRGYQCMTVFKDVKKEAAAASKLAIALAKGQSASSSGLKLTNFNDPKASSHKIQAVLLAPEAITIKNVKDVVTAGALKASQICQGLTSECAKAGIK